MARPSEDYLIMQLRYKKQIPLEIVTKKEEAIKRAAEYMEKKSGTIILFPVTVIDPQKRDNFKRPGFGDYE